MDTHPYGILEGALLAGGLIIASLLAPHTLVLSALQLFCLLYATHSLAPRLAPRHAPIPALLVTFASLLGFQSILQTLAYYANFSLNLTTDITTQVLAIGSLYVLAYFKKTTETPLTITDTSPEQNNASWKTLLKTLSVLIPALIGVAFVIYHTKRVATVSAIRTPWDLLPPGIITAYLLMIGSCWLAAWRRQSTTLVWSLSALFLTSFALLTPLVYPLGFGFDGFLHRASENLLLSTGTLTPKPLYYIGQYTLTTWLARTLSLPLHGIDIFLLVGSLALLPATLARKRVSSSTYQASGIPDPNSRYSILDTRYLVPLAGLALLIPLKPWISTTPQSFAYLMGLSALLLAQDDEHTALLPCLILGLWSALIHPLAGLPLFGAALLCLWQQQNTLHRWLKTSGAILIALGTALIVPLAFFLIRDASNTQAAWQIQNLLSVNQLTTFLDFLRAPAIRISLWADWAAFVEFLFPLFLLLLALLGAWKAKDSSSRGLTLTAILLLSVTYVMQQVATFTFLIDYERQDYTQRLFLVGQLMLLPAALNGLAYIWNNVRKQPALSLYGFLIFMTAWQGARIYRAFPYHDATHIEHGWNVSRNDQEAVRWIERDSQNTPYTVLANQAVSAAAVQELGFKRYADDVFFYPIPTGGRLYQVFLRAASTEVTSEDIKAASQLGQSSLVYLVLNNYWWQANEVAETLAPLADNAYELNQGAVRIYKFDLNKDKKR